MALPHTKNIEPGLVAGELAECEDAYLERRSGTYASVVTTATI